MLTAVSAAGDVFLPLIIASPPYNSAIPKMTLRVFESSDKANAAPMIAPVNAPTSSNVPKRMLVSPCLRYTIEALLELVKTPMKLAPLAKWIGTPRMRVRPGTIINPPPRPRKEPITPARIAIKKLEIIRTLASNPNWFEVEESYIFESELNSLSTTSPPHEN